MQDQFFFMQIRWLRLYISFNILCSIKWISSFLLIGIRYQQQINLCQRYVSTIDASCTKLTCELNVTETTDSECSSFHPDCLNKGFGCIHKSENYVGNLQVMECNALLILEVLKQLAEVDHAQIWQQLLVTANVQISQLDVYSVELDVLVKVQHIVHLREPNQLVQDLREVMVPSIVGELVQQLQEIVQIENAQIKQAQQMLNVRLFYHLLLQQLHNYVLLMVKLALDIGKACSFFKGNDETCLQFTASDGPCKASSDSASPVTCTPRVYDQYSKYHPNCKATCRGCKSSMDVKNQHPKLHVEQIPPQAGQCRNLPTTFGGLTTQSQTICVNNTLSTRKRCAWFIGASTSGCRDFTCTDYDGSISTLKDCQDKETTCITSGTGCITLGLCSSYRLNLFVNLLIQMNYLQDVHGILQQQLVDNDNVQMEYLLLMMHLIFGLLDVKPQKVLVLDQTLDVMYIIAILNSVQRTVLEIHVYILMVFATIMIIAQMLLLQHIHFAKPSLNNVFQQLQLVELLLCVINMKISFHVQQVLIILNVDGYQKAHVKNIQHIVMHKVLHNQDVLVGIQIVFQMEPNVLIKELVLHIQPLQLLIMKVLMDFVSGPEQPVD
ncbi:unnamed protein product [Paramecium primaurelia]|uniref:Uncharacterized protein n=1 Tax=Paramecium primaurelia TaxID=5886 RepID=A0A8S1PE43_PARPR|nr:unnamed protein product [Paramecium primaurelia]